MNGGSRVSGINLDKDKSISEDESIDQIRENNP